MRPHAVEKCLHFSRKTRPNREGGKSNSLRGLCQEALADFYDCLAPLLNSRAGMQASARALAGHWRAHSACPLLAEPALCASCQRERTKRLLFRRKLAACAAGAPEACDATQHAALQAQPSATRRNTILASAAAAAVLALPARAEDKGEPGTASDRCTCSCEDLKTVPA